MIDRGNYSLVLKYLEYQEEVFQLTQKTIRRKWAYLRHLLEWADDVKFPGSEEINPGFPKYLLSARNDLRTEPLSPVSMRKTCAEARRFFHWLKMNDSKRFQKITALWVESIRPSKANSLQSMVVEREYYTLDEVRKLISFSPERFVDERDRAAVAMLFISGMRVGAFVTLPIKCVDLGNLVIHQLPSEGVETKNGKAAKTFLLPLEDLLNVVRKWDHKIRSERDENSHWYPNLTSDGMDWKYGPVGSTESRRVAFARALKRFCIKVGIEYKSPHKLRNGHGVYGIKKARTTEEFKAFSQNMMHKSMEITDSLYGKLASDDVKNVIQNMGENRQITNIEEVNDLFGAFKVWLESQKG